MGFILSRLSGPALRWAKRNLGTIAKWIRDGASFSWIIDKITGMFK